MLDSHHYIEPEDRPAAWADMARQYVARGWPRDEIAYALCVDEPTVVRLLAGEPEREPEQDVQKSSVPDHDCPAPPRTQ